MRNLIVQIILVFFVSSVCQAQTMGPDPILCEQSHEIQPGEPSPCWGILMPQPWVLKGVECLRVDLPHCEKRLSLLEKKWTIELESLQAELEVERAALESQSSVLDEALDLYKPPTWYASPWLWGAVGFAAGAAGAGFLAYSLAR